MSIFLNINIKKPKLQNYMKASTKITERNFGSVIFEEIGSVDFVFYFVSRKNFWLRIVFKLRLVNSQKLFSTKLF